MLLTITSTDFVDCKNSPICCPEIQGRLYRIYVQVQEGLRGKREPLHFIPVGLETHSIKAGDLTQIFLQLLVETAVPLGLLHRGIRMDVGKLGPGDRLGRGSLQGMKTQL